MEAKEATRATAFYLFASSDGISGLTPGTVFYAVGSEALAKSLCRLCAREYSTAGQPGFHCKPAHRFSAEEQILFDEAVDDLRLYTDPDPYVYDPPASQDVLLRAQYAQRAQVWEDLLQQRSDRQPQKAGAQETESGATPYKLTVESALAKLQRAVEKHRLIFLYFAGPTRRNPTNRSELWERLDRDSLSCAKIPSDAVDSDGEFLFEYRWALDHFAQVAVGRFGLGIGAKPRVPTSEGKPIEIEGGSLPVWLLDDIACVYLEQSADAVLDACKSLARVDQKRWFQSLIRKVRQSTHDEGQPRWYSSVMVRWEYLSRLDDVIDCVKTAEIDYQDEVTRDDTPAQHPKESSGGELDELDTKLRAEALSRHAANASPTKGNDLDRTPVHQLAIALQELRLATGDLLHASGKTDIYPEFQIKMYNKAFRDAQARVNGVSEHLAYGRDNPGQIETEIREALNKLSRVMEQVTSDYNDRPGAFPLNKGATDPGWDAMKGLMPLELTLAMTTLKPEEMQMPAEDSCVSGLILLTLLAQAYYKMLECTISAASWCSALDLELNQSYLWVTTNLTNLLQNHEDLKDFPTKFEPLFPDLYPSTIRDVDWDDVVASADAFLGTVQKYVHDKGVYDPEERSTAWTFVQLFRPSVESAIEHAIAYKRRMRQYAQKALGGASVGGFLYRNSARGVESNEERQ